MDLFYRQHFFYLFSIITMDPNIKQIFKSQQIVKQSNMTRNWL